MSVSRPFVPSLRPVISHSVPSRLAPVGAGLLPCLPLIALLIVVIAAFVARIAPPAPDERPFAQGMTRQAALRSAETLCTRLARAPAETVAIHPISTPNADRPTHYEWQIVCRAAAEEYFIRLEITNNGTGDNLISVQRETISHSVSAGSDAAAKSVCIDRDAALILSRRYLVASGLASRVECVTLETMILQDKGRNAYDGYFRCELADGSHRRARLGLSALSGKLNRIQRLGVIRPASPIAPE